MHELNHNERNEGNFLNLNKRTFIMYYIIV